MEDLTKSRRNHGRGVVDIQNRLENLGFVRCRTAGGFNFYSLDRGFLLQNWDYDTKYHYNAYTANYMDWTIEAWDKLKLQTLKSFQFYNELPSKVLDTLIEWELNPKN